MLADFLIKHLDVIFFFYGLSFLILGIVIFLQLRITQKSEFKLLNILWLLALFGITHGINEFIDMFTIIKGELLFLKILGPSVFFISYLFLFLFGYQLINIGNKKYLGFGFLSIIMFLFLSLSAFSGIASFSLWQISARYFLGFPGAILGAIGIFLYYQSESEKLKNAVTKKYFVSFILSLGSYGILGGLIVPKANFFPASVVNNEAFISWTGIPVQCFRAICAVIITWSVWHIMDIFNIEVDIERRKLAKMLKSSEASFHSIVERGPDGIIVVDQKRIARFVNSTSASFFGRKPEELLGELFGFPVEAGQVTEVEIFRPGGQKGVGEMRIAETSWEDEIASLVMTKDITERKKTEEQQKSLTESLEARNEELENLIRIVSHDLKEPLRSIYAYSKFLEDDYGDELKQRDLEYLKRLRKNAVVMRDLFEDALEISTLERSTVQIELVQISDILNEVKLRLEYSIKQKNMEIVIQDNLPKIFCDRVRLMEVFANLFSNAIKFNDKPDPRIEVGYAERDDYHEFYVKDNGPGIEQQYYEKIFEIFQRLGKREDQEGTGAGLTIVRKIIEMHKGKIWVDSKVGEYATFYFTIPKLKQDIAGKKKLGEILVERKLVTKEEVKKALEEQRETV